MRTVRIYAPGDYEPGQLFSLSKEGSHHVSSVLRMQVDEPLTLFRNDKLEFSCLIHSIHKKQVIVRIMKVEEVNRESPLLIHLAQAISKGDKMDWVVQKAVELGVASITPILSSRCVVKLDKEKIEKKIHLWQSIVISACEQSGRNTLPILHPPTHLKDYMKTPLPSSKFVLDPEANKKLKEYTMDVKVLSILIGPEGGLSPDEINTLLAHGFNALSLGPRILRTETAALTVLSLLQGLYGDL